MKVKLNIYQKAFDYNRVKRQTYYYVLLTRWHGVCACDIIIYIVLETHQTSIFDAVECGGIRFQTITPHVREPNQVLI